jgi:hypothetical protein
MMHGFLRYSHKNRALAFARFHRLSLPKKATISERSNPTIIDESPNINPASTKNPENSFGDSRINWDNENGMGATGDNRDIDYRGFQIELSAKDFRNLTPSDRTTSD